MDVGEGVRSVIPVEETIIDPLYEPLKLNRYELCDHLQRLKDVSHLRYGLSPYLLFDVEGMREVVETIGFLFRIENKGKEDLKKKIREDTEIPEELEVEFKSKGFLLPEGKKKKEGLMEGLWKIDGKSGLCIIVEEDDSLKVCYFEKDKKEVNDFYENYKNFIEKFKKYLHLFERYVNWDRNPIEGKDENIRWDSKNPFLLCEEKEYKNKTSLNNRNEIYWELRLRKEEIIGNQERKKEEIYKEVKNKYRKILEQFLYTSNGFNDENYKKIAHLFRLEYPVKVKCPLCEEEKEIDPAIKPWMFMCEEGKIYSMKEALLRTFEFRRARWLYMSGALHTVHRASTHTRLSHEIGSMIVAVNALYEIDVYPHDDMSMLLGEYLLMRGELHEFLMANFLHDLGHAPLSHVLEPNPFIKLDHEKITRNLILGKKTEKEEEMDWYVTECYLLKMKAIKDFEYRFFENRYDPIYEIDVEKEVGKELDEDKLRGYFLEYLDKKNEIPESEIVTVSEVLDNFGVDKERVVEILTGKIFCPNCKRYLFTIEEIEKNGNCKICNEKVNIDEVTNEKIYDTQFLNKLIDSEIDFDRIDHVKRDSVVCGLSLISFRLLELLGSMSIVLPKSDVHKEIHNRDNKPYILISEDGLLYVMDLLTARRSVFRDILYSDENNWINGVVNQITALAVRYLPHFKNMLPFITDPILAHFYTNDMFLGTQIEKLNKLFHGVMDYSAYGKPMRYKLKEGVIVKDEDIKKMYRLIEDINDEYERLEFPAVVFYTNIKPTKCPNCRKEGTLKESKKMLCPSCKKELTAELKCKNENCDRFERTIKPEEAVKVLECNKCNAFSVIIDPLEDLEKLSECPFCGRETEKVKKNCIKCKGKECGKLVCKLIDQRWDDMLVYGKKFKKTREDKEKEDKEKYYQFKDLVGKYKDTSRERFPERPSELDVKNLFYVWVSDFAITKEKNEEKWKEEIKEKIGEIWAGSKAEEETEEEFKSRKISEFDSRFVNLDVTEEGGLREEKFTGG